ncbi:MAG: type II secretion system F family protein [Nitrospirota bacterium]|nr:type II secretion system F family protein [Nitrospirota bacterium]
MAKYRYRAVDGVGKRVEGVMVAEDVSKLEAQLLRDGYWLVEAKEGKETSTSQKTAWKKGSRRLLIGFAIHMNSLLSAGVQVSPAVRGMVDQAPDPEFRAVMEAIWRRLETGTPLHEALKEHPSFFPEEIANLIQAGEESGKLPYAFGEIRRYLEWVERMMGDVRQATLYPTVVLVFLSLFIVLLFTFVIPRFATVLVDLNVELPFITIMIMGVSEFMLTTWYVWIPALIGVPLVLGLARRSAKFSYLVDEYKLRLPIYGEMAKMIAISRFAQNFGVLFRSGVPILRCLRLCQKLVGNQVVERALVETERAVSEGLPLSTCLSRHRVFPPMVLQMVSVGETSGKLGETMGQVAEFYNEEIPRRMKRVFGTLEPMVTVLLIGIMGVVAVSIFLPMMSLVGGVR